MASKYKYNCTIIESLCSLPSCPFLLSLCKYKTVTSCSVTHVYKHNDEHKEGEFKGVCVCVCGCVG